MARKKEKEYTSILMGLFMKEITLMTIWKEKGFTSYKMDLVIKVIGLMA
jgi:hypothetical protein